MGFTAQPVRQRVMFHPWLAPLANDTSSALVKRLTARYPTVAPLAKAEGMLRFYCEGKRPPAEQEWPEGLMNRRSELLTGLS